MEEKNIELTKEDNTEVQSSEATNEPVLSKEEPHKIMEEDKAEVITKIVEGFGRDRILPMWRNYSIVNKFKSVRRAIRRGHVDLFTGCIYPSRPFNNKKPTKGRETNELKKQIYGQLKSRAAAL